MKVDWVGLVINLVIFGAILAGGLYTYAEYRRAKRAREEREKIKAERRAKKELFAQKMRDTPTASEARMARLLTAHGIEYETQTVVCGYIADFYLVDALLVIEIDGAIHETPKQQRYDAVRDSALKLGGYKVLRIKSDWLYMNPDRVIAEVNRAREISTLGVSAGN